MDAMLSALTDFVASVDAAALPTSVVHTVIRQTVDSVACGAGGFTGDAAEIARRTVEGTVGPLCASAYGLSSPVLVDAAAFANATADRYLDYNDFGASGHPSDMIPALLALTEAVGAPGRAAVAGIHIAYEVATTLAEAVPPDGGWDQGLYCSLGVAAGASHILGLDRTRTAAALSLSIVPSVPLRTTRFGELSTWKAAATAHATMTALFAVRMAALGMSGPAAPFEGKDGVFERVWPALPDIRFGADEGRPAAIERASLKRYPACFWAQVGIDLVVGLRARVDPAAVTAIEVATARSAWWSIGGGRGDAAEKWRPGTRETADHSMPFLLASALLDGHIDERTFAATRLTDPGLLSLMDRISVVERADLTASATRDRCPTELTLRLDDGTELSAGNEVAKGHPGNPMSDADIADKFAEFTARVLPDEDASRLAELLWNLPALRDLSEVGAMFRAFAPR